MCGKKSNTHAAIFVGLLVKDPSTHTVALGLSGGPLTKSTPDRQSPFCSSLSQPANIGCNRLSDKMYICSLYTLDFFLGGGGDVSFRGEARRVSLIGQV